MFIHFACRLLVQNLHTWTHTHIHTQTHCFGAHYCTLTNLTHSICGRVTTYRLPPSQALHAFRRRVHSGQQQQCMCHGAGHQRLCARECLQQCMCMCVYIVAWQQQCKTYLCHSERAQRLSAGDQLVHHNPKAVQITCWGQVTCTHTYTHTHGSVKCPPSTLVHMLRACVRAALVSLHGFMRTQKHAK